MDISSNTTGKVTVVTLGGRLDAYAANDVEKKVESLITGGQVNLVINLSKLEYISSSGLRILLGALKKSKKQQGDVRLTGLQPYVKEVFDIAGFTPLFKMYNTEDEATKSYQGA